MELTYLDVKPRAAIIGQVRVRIDQELRTASIIRKIDNEQSKIGIVWSSAWPTAIAQRLDEPAIVRYWIAQRRFRQWQKETCNCTE